MPAPLLATCRSLLEQCLGTTHHPSATWNAIAYREEPWHPSAWWNNFEPHGMPYPTGSTCRKHFPQPTGNLSSYWHKPRQMPRPTGTTPECRSLLATLSPVSGTPLILLATSMDNGISADTYILNLNGVLGGTYILFFCAESHFLGARRLEAHGRPRSWEGRRIFNSSKIVFQESKILRVQKLRVYRREKRGMV